MEVHFGSKYIISDSIGFENDVARDFALTLARGCSMERTSVIVGVAHHISPEDAMNIYLKKGSPVYDSEKSLKMLAVRRDDMLEDVGKLLRLSVYDLDTVCLIAGIKHKLERNTVFELYTKHVRTLKKAG